jgi:hypothetical protein
MPVANLAAVVRHVNQRFGSALSELSAEIAGELNSIGRTTV